VNRWGYLGLVIILIVTAIFVYQLRHDLWFGSPAKPAQPPTTGGPPKTLSAGINWQHVDRTMDGFQIDMPSSAQQTRIPAYNEHGGTEQADMLYAYPDPQICYSVTWAEDPPVERINSHVPDKTLDMALTDALDRSQTLLLTRAEISQQGFPGRDFTARNTSGGVMVSRLVLARHRLYMLTATFPSSEARNDQDTARFFSSFNVVVPARAN
jgi:hypothetical protein